MFPSKIKCPICLIITASFISPTFAASKVDGYGPYSKYLAAQDVISENCLALDPSDTDYIKYRVAASKLLTVMNVDAQLYNQTYKTLYTNTRNETPEERGEWCEKLRPNIVRETYEINGDYEVAIHSLESSRQAKAQKWANAIDAIAVTLLAVGTAYAMSSQYNAPQYQYIPMSLPVPNFGNTTRLKSPNHYLVNTSSGFKQCTVVSNIVNCF